MSDGLKRTPLHALHLELGGRMVPFAGYEMPVQYGEGLRAEHLWTREQAGLFDVSHMRQLRVRGEGLHAALERALPVDFAEWPDGLQKYSLLLNERGGIDDDLMVTKLADEVAIVVNAACREADLARLRLLCPRLEFSVRDHALIAIQGPRAEEAVATLEPAVRHLRFMHSTTIGLAGADCVVSRSGYTGEDGFEISVPASHAVALASALLAHADVKPVGLGARDTLRLEAALHLYGQDMNQATTVCEAGLAWAIAAARREGGAKAGGYPGADVTLREARDGVKRKLVGLVGVEAIPVRSGADLVDTNGRSVGTVTSGTVSPTLGRPVMLAYLETGLAVDVDVFAVVRGKRCPVTRAALPFVAKRYKR